MVAHAACLIFGAWWLVATTALPGPAVDCFTGIANPTRLEVTLGERKSAFNAASTPPCDGIDGLAQNATLVLDLSQGPRPEEGGGCYGYETQAVSGTNGVTVQKGPDAPGAAGATLTSASGTFVSPELPDCAGTWSLVFYRAGSIISGELTSPLDAGSDMRWTVQRTIRSNRPSACLGTFARGGVLTCGEEFAVVSIREVPAP
jgi:hypothetical protein